jgi:hypothetical protein
MDRLRIVRIMGLSFGGLIVVLAVVLVALAGDWDNPDDDLARLGMIVSGAAGVLGLVVALWWRNRMTSRPLPPARLMNGFLISVAAAETGMLLGFVFAIGSMSTGPFWVGAAIFAISLTILVTGLSQAEVEQPGPL